MNTLFDASHVTFPQRTTITCFASCLAAVRRGATVLSTEIEFRVTVPPLRNAGLTGILFESVLPHQLCK